MSFGILCLRIMLTVAAVVLIGCDFVNNNVGGGSDKPSLTIAIAPAKPKAGESITITVTVKGELDGKVNIGVDNCGGQGDALLEAKDYDVTNNKATAGLEEHVLTTTTDSNKCKITATATVDGKDITAEHEFMVAATADNTDQGYTLTLSKIIPIRFGGAHTVTATIKKEDGSDLGNADTAAATAAIAWTWHCAAAMPTDYAAIQSWLPAMKPDSSGSTPDGSSNGSADDGEHDAAIILGDTNSPSDKNCVVRACTTIDTAGVCGYQTAVFR